MNLTLENYLYITVFGLCLMLLFAPTRSLLATLLKGPGVKLWGSLMSFLLMIIKAHIMVIRNFAPRRVVLPTLEKKKPS